MDFKPAIAALHDELIALRRDFHRHPEIGFQEVRTSKIVEDYLKDLGLEVRRCAGTGVIGVLRGKYPGKTALMRCDIDALPMTEESGEEFSSENPGAFHGCGHDAHTAIHMVTAKIMTQYRDKLHGNVVFLFQPNEEDAGAEIMIEDGAMDDNPDATFGFHVQSPWPTGSICVVPGPLEASSWYFKLTIHGKGGHGGVPHSAISPIDAAAHVLEAIKTFHTLEQDATKLTLITVCMVHSGEKNNIIANDCEMQGSVRCLHDGDAAVRARFKQLCEDVCRAYRCTCEIEFKCGNSLVYNDPALTNLVTDIADKVVGRENIITEGIRMMGGDDFAEFSKRVPGVYYFVGMRNEEVGSVYEHHSPFFRTDEACMPIAVEMQLEIIANYLGMNE